MQGVVSDSSYDIKKCFNRARTYLSRQPSEGWFSCQCVCVVSDQTSKAGNVKYCPQLHARSGLRFIIRLQENTWIVPTRALGWATDPRISGHHNEGWMRVKCLGTDNSWPWASMKSFFGLSCPEEVRRQDAPIKNITSWNLSVDSATKKYVIF
jgi:hypothetical protein